MAIKKRYQAFKYEGKSTMPGKAYVYDYDAGGVARDESGKLVWTKTLAEAKRWADEHNRIVTVRVDR